MNDRNASALGAAVIEKWGELPQEVQQTLFEAAVIAGHHTERDESLREQLTKFLHEKHPRTTDGNASVGSRSARQCRRKPGRV
jgi:hypothetical protein